MPAKSTSPEAAQRKLWKLEIRDLEKAGNKIQKDFRAARMAATKEYDRISKIETKALMKFSRTINRLEKAEPAALKKINARIAQLKGRI